MRPRAARDFGMGSAAVQSAMEAISEQHYARWYFLLAGMALVVWFSVGVVRALFVAFSVAWGLRPVRLRRPLLAGLVFTGIAIVLMAASTATQYCARSSVARGSATRLRRFYLGCVLWVMDKLPHRGTSGATCFPARCS